jgi:cytochrome c oxidase subunit 2
MLQSLPFLPERASEMAGRVDALFIFLTLVTGLIALLVVVLIVTFSIRYRRRAPNEIGAPIPGSLRLEILWSALPFVISIAMFGWGAFLFMEMRQPPDSALEISVVAKQWMWKLQHPTGRVEINELHVPLGRDVRLIMTSEDVIHSFFVPAFRVKTDVLPDRYRTLWFHATRAGRYHLFCAQYCGTSHAKMGGWVTVLEPADFEVWLSGGAPGESPEEAGARLFDESGCDNCHRAVGPNRAPTLAGLFGSAVRLQSGDVITADADYIRESILYPRAKIVAGYEPIMPSFQGQLNAEQILQLIAYIRSGSSSFPGLSGPRDREGDPIRSDEGLR